MSGDLQRKLRAVEALRDHVGGDIDYELQHNRLAAQLSQENEELKVTRLRYREWVDVQLEFILQLDNDLQARDKRIVELEKENSNLRNKLERMTRRVGLSAAAASENGGRAECEVFHPDCAVPTPPSDKKGKLKKKRGLESLQNDYNTNTPAKVTKLNNDNNDGLSSQKTKLSSKKKIKKAILNRKKSTIKRGNIVNGDGQSFTNMSTDIKIENDSETVNQNTSTTDPFIGLPRTTRLQKEILSKFKLTHSPDHHAKLLSPVKSKGLSKVSNLTKIKMDVAAAGGGDGRVDVKRELSVPTWRVLPLSNIYCMEGTEHIGEGYEVLEKRHKKHEEDEKKRKRWDLQRMREDEMRLKQERQQHQHQQAQLQQSSSSSNLSKLGAASPGGGNKGAATDNTNGNGKPATHTCCDTLEPDPSGIKVIMVTDDLPFSVWGACVNACHLPTQPTFFSSKERYAEVKRVYDTRHMVSKLRKKL